ncbi:unnamed protein product [Closterium sp. NIES-54]
MSTLDVGTRSACSRRQPLQSRPTPVDATVDFDHSILLRAIVAADSCTAFDLVVDATFVLHRSRRIRTGGVFRRPLRPHAQLNDQQGDRPVLAICVAFPRISQVCLQGVRYARISYGVDHGDYRCYRPTNDLVGAKVGSYLKLSPPIVPHEWTVQCSLHARPSSPSDYLRSVLLHSSPRRSPPPFVLPSPTDSSLTASSSHPIIDYYRTARPVVSRVVTSLVTDLRASQSSVSAVVASISDFPATRRVDNATRCLDYATRMVPARPLSTGHKSSLDCDVLEVRQYELEYLAAASSSLCHATNP